MDIIADAAIVLGLGRDAALNETLSWLQHCLARHAALEAARAKTTARATLTATACGMGVKDAHHDFNAFQAQMDAIIAAASAKQTTTPTGVTREEIALFEAIERQALANSKKKT